jgi:L-serine/L-threonine ammonia-lyase
LQSGRLGFRYAPKFNSVHKLIYQVPLVALETHGSNCFFEAMVANKRQEHTASSNVDFYTNTANNVEIARLRQITSKATSLGASEASAAVVRMALDRAGGVTSVTIPDEMSMKVVQSFVGKTSINWCDHFG